MPIFEKYGIVVLLKKIERLQIERSCLVIFVWIIWVLHWDFLLIPIGFFDQSNLSLSETQRICSNFSSKIAFRTNWWGSSQNGCRCGPLKMSLHRYRIHTFYCEIFAQALCLVFSLLFTAWIDTTDSVLCLVSASSHDSHERRNVLRETFRIEPIAGYVLLVSGERCWWR